MDVFSIFPEAILDGVWEIGRNIKDTVLGRRFDTRGTIGVIVDEGSSVSGYLPEAISNDLLLYVRPCDLPKTDVNVLVADYCWMNVETGQYYSIVDVSVGKNQAAGIAEHYAFRIRPTEVIDE